MMVDVGVRPRKKRRTRKNGRGKHLGGGVGGGKAEEEIRALAALQAPSLFPSRFLCHLNEYITDWMVATLTRTCEAILVGWGL